MAGFRKLSKSIETYLKRWLTQLNSCVVNASHLLFISRGTIRSFRNLPGLCVDPSPKVMYVHVCVAIQTGNIRKVAMGSYSES